MQPWLATYTNHTGAIDFWYIVNMPPAATMLEIREAALRAGPYGAAAIVSLRGLLSLTVRVVDEPFTPIKKQLMAATGSWDHYYDPESGQPMLRSAK